MADYKVIDAEQLDADLLSIANKIREKAETSGGMAFPDEFLSALDAITLGESLAGISKFETGSFTLTSDQTSDKNISLNMEDTPNFYIVVAPAAAKSADYAGYLVHQTGIKRYFYQGSTLKGAESLTMYVTSSGSLSAAYGIPSSASNMFKAGSFTISGSKGLKSGVKYTWYAGVIDGLG